MPSPISEHTVPWPAADADRYVAEGYWAGVPLGTLLRAVADRTPDAPAVADPAGDPAGGPADGTRLTHGELAGRADAAASRLLDLGLAPGDRIVVQLPNGWEFAVLTLACLRAGLVPVMALPAHRRAELTYLAVHAEATAIAVPDRLRDFDHQGLARELAAEVTRQTDGPWHVLVAGGDVTPGSVDLRALCAPGTDPAADRARLDALTPSVSGRDVAVFLLSGGTTGLPKLIARTHDDYAYNARASARIAGLDSGTRYLVSLPAGHNFPLACPGILGTLLAGGQVVMLPSPEPRRAFATIAAEGVTHTAVVPAVAGRWLEHAAGSGDKGQLKTLRVLQVGGARIADELARRVEPVLGARLQQVFGMAEGLLNYTRLDDPDDVIWTTQGRPLSPADEVRLVDEDGRDVPEGEPGSLLTRGPYTPRGYYRAAEQNARSFTADGWYRSGDICRRTPEGNLIVEGRDKDMINRGGEKISAEEVENLVYRLPVVSQVAAVAMPDPLLGERVCLYVVPRPGAETGAGAGAAGLTLDQVRQSMEDLGVARFKFPEHLVLTDSLPATKVGKIDKKALRADIARRLAAPPRNHTARNHTGKDRAMPGPSSKATGETLQQLIDSTPDLVEYFYNDAPAPHFSRAGTAKTGAFIPPAFTNWRDEQNAWQETAALLHQSHHMPELFLDGPDALRLLERLGINSVANFTQDRAKQWVACTPAGHVIGDCIAYRLGEQRYELVSGMPVLDWVAYNAEAGDWDVTVTRDAPSNINPTGQRTNFRFQLDGPNAGKIFDKVVEGGAPEIKFFRTARVTIAGTEVLVLRHGMAGHQGVELSGPFANETRVRDAILEAGAEFGIKPVGTTAYFSTPLSNAWMAYPVPGIFTGEDLRGFREWLSATGWEAKTELGGSFRSDNVEDYYVTPYDIGYGSIMKFDHDFIGRAALEALPAERRRTKVTLVWNRDDVERVFASQFGPGPRYKAIDFPVAYYAWNQFDEVRSSGSSGSAGALAGLSCHAGYLNPEGELLSLAMMNHGHAEPGSEVTITWGEPGGGSRKPQVERHEQTQIRATVASAPYASSVRRMMREDAQGR